MNDVSVAGAGVAGKAPGRLLAPGSNLSLAAKAALILVPMLLVIVGTLASGFLVVSADRRAEAKVTASLKLTDQIGQTIRMVSQAESGVRGYLVTGQSSFLDPYSAAIRDLPGSLRQLSRTVAADPAQAQLAAKTTPLARQTLDALEKVVALPQGSAPGVLTAALIWAKAAADSLRGTLSTMLQNAKSTLARQVAAANRFQSRVSVRVGLALAVAVLLATSMMVYFARQIVVGVRRIEENALRLEQGKPLLAAPAGRDELGRLSRTLLAVSDRLLGRERSLRESEARKAAILASIGEGLVITDADGRIESINSGMEQMAGWKEHEVIGLGFSEVYRIFDERGAAVPESERQLAKALSSATVVTSRGFDHTLLTRDGLRVPVSVVGAPIMSGGPDGRDGAGGGQVSGGVVLVRDVSYEFEIDQMKSALVSTVSHELRTPLTMIQGFAELLHGRQLAPEKADEAVSTIDAAAQRLGRLIDDLLSVSRIDSGRMIMHMGPVDLGRVIEEALVQFGGDRKVVVDIDDPFPMVHADRDRLLQVVTNLISNACKYSDKAAPVGISVASSGSDAQVSVSDKGIGMSPQQMERLFEKFYRVDHPAVREAGGTGLGLYITKRLVEMQGGRISVKSEPGVGTTFHFSVPLAQAAVASAT